MECRARALWILLLITATTAAGAWAQSPGSDLQIQTTSLPSPRIGSPYSANVAVTGGVPPYKWEVTRGKLPVGISLQPESGFLSGTPTAPGSFNFTVAVTDTQGNRITHDFTTTVADYLAVEFKRGPLLNSNVVAGEMEVRNNSEETYDLTVIIVAVNEIGKAFALGYQHFQLGPQLRQSIPYSSSLPNGTYIVHADAIGEIAEKPAIRRARLQTQIPIIVNVNR